MGIFNRGPRPPEYKPIKIKEEEEKKVNPLKIGPEDPNYKPIKIEEDKKEENDGIEGKF